MKSMMCIKQAAYGLLCSVLLMPLQAQAYEAESEQAGEMAEKFLAAFGGRDVWKDVKAVRVLAVNHFPGIDKPALFEVFTNFEQPGNMFRIINHDLNRLRAYVGDRGWTAKREEEGWTAEPYDAVRLEGERFLWEGTFSRNLWRVASRDPNLVVGINDRGDLELRNADGRLTGWLEMKPDGELVRFGFGHDMENGVNLGAYAQYGQFRLPVAGETGGVQFESVYFQPFYQVLNIPAEAPEDFAAFNPAQHIH